MVKGTEVEDVIVAPEDNDDNDDNDDDDKDEDEDAVADGVANPLH